MDLEIIRIFVKVAELQSFTSAGEQLGMPKSRVSLRVRDLETQLGSRLLQRSTRSVRLTPDGEQLLPRARRLLAEADEVTTMFQAPSSLRGRVRMDLPVNYAREIIIPRLPELLAAHPLLEVSVSTTDRRVDLVREGFDFVLRVGTLSKSPDLIARRLGMMPMINCASPAYIGKYGMPRTLEDLERGGHLVIHYSQAFGTEDATFEYPDPPGSNRYRELPLKSIITVNSADALRASCLAGLGIIQVPRTGVAQLVKTGGLVEVLPEYTCEPMPVSIVQSARNASKRVRHVMNWLADVLKPHLEADSSS